MNTIKKLFLTSCLISGLLFYATPAFAVGDCVGSACPPTFFDFLAKFSGIYNFIQAIAAVVLFFMLIKAGVQLMFTQGDQKALESGRRSLIFAIVGFIVIFSPTFIISVLSIQTGLRAGIITKSYNDTSFQANVASTYTATPLPSYEINTVTPTPSPVGVTGPVSSLGHFAGVMQIKYPSEVGAAEAVSLDTALQFEPIESHMNLYATMNASHMGIIDGYISQLLQIDKNNHNQLYADVRTHIQRVQGLDDVKGYWVLDDQGPSGGIGAQRDELKQIKQIIEQYTPAKPTMCGFGPFFGDSSGYGIDSFPALYSDYNPAWCDLIGIYAYPAPNGHADSWFEWNMNTMWKQMESDFKNGSGYSLYTSPIVGVPMAFGGGQGGTGWVLPSEQDIAQQSQGYCEHGASALSYFAWNGEDFIPPIGNTAAANANIRAGIRDGIANCKFIWQ